MVHSANDMAVVLAEGVAGSIEDFADEMNATARRLGMTQSSFVNPNGLPADDQITSARDLAILARALIREFPEYDYYWHIPAIKFGKRVMRNYNSLIGRYPGADGMKTGFICASGFNLVASATRGGKRLIAVVLGAPSSQARAMKAAQLLERGFNSSTRARWLMPVARHGRRARSRSTRRRPICARRCAASTASGRATEDEDEALGANAESRFALCGVPREPAPESQGRRDRCREISLGAAGRGLHRPGPQARRSAAGHGRHQAEEAQAGRDRQGRRRRQDRGSTKPDAKPDATKPAAKPAASRQAPRTAAAARPRRSRQRAGSKPKPKKPAPKTAGHRRREQPAGHAGAMTGGADAHARSGRAHSAHRADRLPRRRQDHAAQPPDRRPGARRDRRHHQRVRRDRPRSPAGARDPRRRRAAAERLPVLHAARRPGRRAGAAAARSRQRPRDLPPRDPGDHRPRRSGAGAADRDGASLSGDALPARRRHHGGRRGQRRRDARRAPGSRQAGRGRRPHRAEQDRPRRHAGTPRGHANA